MRRPRSWITSPSRRAPRRAWHSRPRRPCFRTARSIGPAAAITINQGNPTIDACDLSASTAVRAIDMLNAANDSRSRTRRSGTAWILDLTDPNLVVTGNTFVDYTVGLGFRLNPDHVSKVFAGNTVRGRCPASAPSR
jgi:hypothetical protein